MDINHILEMTIQVAKEAGYKIKNERDFDIKEKTDAANLVTSMDIEIQNMVLAKLVDILPQASIYAEENDIRQMSDGYVWIVDPIDGTSNYAYDLKHSCISIGLIYQKEGLMGVVYNPYLDEVYYAIKGQGAFNNGKPIHVSDNPVELSLFSIGTSPYYKEDMADVTFDTIKRFFLKGRDIRRSGSAALDLCYLACGRYDGFYEQLLSPWDYAASTTIIKEAGGIIETLEPYTWTYENAIPIVAGNKNNFKEMVEIIKG